MLPQPHPLARSVLGLAILVFGAASVAGPRAAVRKTQTKTPGNTCTTCLERRPILDSLLFQSVSDRDVPRAYEAARRFPDIIDRLHCFCECKENQKEGHKTLLTCFTSEHAAGCGICQKEALLAAQLKDRGIADDDIERTVESLFRLDGHPPTFGRGM
jgi:hypothetical protein